MQRLQPRWLQQYINWNKTTSLNAKGVGRGVHEYRINFGPDYRVYFGKDGDRLVIVLAGGTKNCQDMDIATAKKYWQDYKRRKRQEV